MAVKTIDWSYREAVLDISREKVRGSPPCDPAAIIDRAYEKNLHGYYDWAGHGW